MNDYGKEAPIRKPKPTKEEAVFKLGFVLGFMLGAAFMSLVGLIYGY